MTERYDVHLYVTVRVKVEGVEAESMADAIATAEAMTDLHTLLDNERMGYNYAEEINGALVDVEGDVDYLESSYFVPRGEAWVPEQMREPK